MRDLDQLEEQDPEERRRRIGTWFMAAVIVLALILAIGVVMTRSAEPRDSAEHDPLDQLDRVAGPALATTADALTDRPKTVPAIDTSKLTFERDLTEHEERPEVLAALEAAAREEQSLAHEQSPAQPSSPASAAKPDPRLEPVTAAKPDPQVKPTPEARPAKARAPVADADDEPEQARVERVQNAMPAGMAASSASHKLAQAARHDKLVANALPKPSSQPRARMGEDGEFTLQVISYDTSTAAQAFANGLRNKGYEAFVVTGEVDGRGRYYRVRIGPFKTKPQAEAYRHTFETQERMNTIVVKRLPTE